MPLWSLLWVVSSLVVTGLVAIVFDLSVLLGRNPGELVLALAITVTTFLYVGVGSIIEWRRRARPPRGASRRASPSSRLRAGSRIRPWSWLLPWL